MHFEIELDQRLTAAISPTYDVGNYTGAIIAAVQLLSDVIRNKSGLESDGQTLAGQAFGGTNPIIKLNSLRTESEKDEQKGAESLIRGIYTGIRNPRSHEIRQDNAETANSIITFVNWLIRLIEGSKSPFDPNDIIQRILDEHFVTTVQYAALIAVEVPPRIRLDVLIRLVETVTFARALNAKMFIASLLVMMNEAEQSLFWDYVSSKFMASTSDSDLMTLVRISSEHWLKCSEVARLRTENRLLKSAKDGRVDSDNRILKGWPGVRVREIRSFSMTIELHQILSDKMLSSDLGQRRYVYRYFMDLFMRLEPVPSERTKQVLAFRLTDQDFETYSALEFLEALEEDHPWCIALQDSYRTFVFKDDDIPF